MRILVADDNALIRASVAEMLSDNGWEVCGEAPDAPTAIEKARALQPDMVLLDISMPGMDGLQLASILRCELPALKIVIVSNHELGQFLPANQKHLADGFVDKTRMGTDLPTVIRNIETAAASPTKNSARI